MNLGKRRFEHPSLHGEETDFPLAGRIIGGYGRSGGAKYNRAVINDRHDFSRVPAVIPWSFPLLIGGIIFFIHHNEP